MKQKDGQLTLFGDDHEVKKVAKRTHLGGSSNPIVFMDYEGFLAKFTEKAKTTDDCYTPKDVYEAVVKYVGTVTDLTGKVICRPFYPGGDYETAEYPDNCVVIDNPPFSLFSKICRFYSESGVPFFLFGPGLTILSCCKYCTAVVIANQIKFDNGALVKCNFASNLYGDLIVTTAPLLDNLLMACPSQQAPKELPKFRYPIELLSTSQLQSLSRGGGALRGETQPGANCAQSRPVPEKQRALWRPPSDRNSARAGQRGRARAGQRRTGTKSAGSSERQRKPMGQGPG